MGNRKSVSGITTLGCLPRPLPLQQIPKNCSKLSSNFVLCKDKSSPKGVKSVSQWAEKEGQISCKMSFWCSKCDCHKKKWFHRFISHFSLKKKKIQQTRIVHLLILLHSPSHLILQAILCTHFTEEKTEPEKQPELAHSYRVIRHTKDSNPSQTDSGAPPNAPPLGRKARSQLWGAPGLVPTQS